MTSLTLLLTTRKKRSIIFIFRLPCLRLNNDDIDIDIDIDDDDDDDDDDIL